MRSKKIICISVEIILLVIAVIIYYNTNQINEFESMKNIKNRESKIEEKLKEEIIKTEVIKDDVKEENSIESEEEVTKDKEIIIDQKDEVSDIKTNDIKKEERVENNTPSNESIKEKDKEDTTKDKEINTPKPTKTQEQINDEFRKNIEITYGVSIKYGNEMGDYKLRGYLPTKLLDPIEIHENLENIEEHIAYYPVGFFKEMKDFGMPLTIYLVKNIPNSGIAGIADKEFYSDIKITVCTDQFFFRVFHHEVFHYIEAYMEIVGYENGIFTDWNSLNPEGFVYGNTVSSYSYSMISPPSNSYFINDYGQTNDREDRATIFEDLMARAYETSNSFVSTNNIWLKGKSISLEIDKYFNTVNSSTTERWERFIYN